MATTSSTPTTKYPFPSNINVANFVTLKLNENNYLLWETQVLSLIESQDLLGFLTGATRAPPEFSNTDKNEETISNPEYVAWICFDHPYQVMLSLFPSCKVMSCGIEKSCHLVQTPRWLLLHNETMVGKGSPIEEEDAAVTRDLAPEAVVFPKQIKGTEISLAPTLLLCDNLSALRMTTNPIFHARTKHIEIDYHFVREKVALGSLITRYIPSSLQIADIFTKPLPRSAFADFRLKLGLWSSTATSLQGGVEESYSTSTSTAAEDTDRIVVSM